VDKRENTVPHGCRDGHVKPKRLQPSAGTMGFKSQAIKVKDLLLIRKYSVPKDLHSSVRAKLIYIILLRKFVYNVCSLGI
jgi:hypothetical protein